MVTLSPPLPAAQSEPYFLSIDFFDETSGILADVSGVQADITFGSEAPLVPDTAGPFVWDGSSSSAAPGAVWRTGTGQYSLWWDIPANLAGGAYVVTWTMTYQGDNFLVTENFPVQALSPEINLAGDTGFWTGSLTYQPAWTATPLVISFGAVDVNGVAWILQNVDGWDGPPTAVGQVIQRSADHGGYATTQYYGPRIVTLTVMASAPTQALRDQARAQLQQTVPVSDLGVFQYNEPLPRVAYVRRNATAGVTEKLPSLSDAIFTIPLVAPDPRKYAPAAQSLSSITATPPAVPLTLPFTSGFPVTFPARVGPGTQGVLCVNSGTFETRPVVTVTGPISSPSVINASTGQAVTFTGLVLPANAQLTLDMDARQAYVSGVFYAADPSSSWWVLEPGETLIYMTGTGSAASVLSVQFSSAWI